MGKTEFKTFVKSQIAENFDKNNARAIGKKERILDRNVPVVLKQISDKRKQTIFVTDI